MASRLKARLAKLEATTAAGPASDEANRLLVGLLGRLDALFWPWREWNVDRAEIRRLQQAYVAGREGLAARAQGESNWKSLHFARNELIERQLVIPQISGGQVTSVRLTPLGIATARAMVGERLAALEESILVALYVKHMAAEGKGHAAPWILENDIFPNRCNGSDPTAWNGFTELVLPALRCGLLESNSDSWHRCYYRFVDGIIPQEEPTVSASVQPWGDDAYTKAFNDERRALRSVAGSDGLFIPVRCT